MNKNQLIDMVADKSDLSKIQVKKTLELLLNGITEGLKKDNFVQLIGFGTFKVQSRQGRLGRNPKNGEEIRIPAKKVTSFVSGKILKECFSAPEKK